MIDDLFPPGTKVIYVTPHGRRNGKFYPSQEIMVTYQRRCYRGPRFDRHEVTWRDDLGDVVRRYVSCFALRAAPLNSGTPNA